MLRIIDNLFVERPFPTSVDTSSIRVASAHTESPLIRRHNTLSEEGTRHHNTLAATDAASRMPAHKITMAGSGQKTAFCAALALKQNTIHTLVLLTPHRSKWISMRHTEGQCCRTDTHAWASGPTRHARTSAEMIARKSRSSFVFVSSQQGGQAASVPAAGWDASDHESCSPLSKGTCRSEDQEDSFPDYFLTSYFLHHICWQDTVASILCASSLCRHWVTSASSGWSRSSSASDPFAATLPQFKLPESLIFPPVVVWYSLCLAFLVFPLRKTFHSKTLMELLCWWKICSFWNSPPPPRPLIITHMHTHHQLSDYLVSEIHFTIRG